jgi:shikimate dehydrogenase
MFAKQTAQSLEYGKQEVAPADFADFVRDFFAQGGSGLNVTLPHKEAARHLCDQVSARADLAGAVNTLSIKDGKLYGDNTDGPGLIRDISVNHDYPLADKSILMLGAGGAARGVLAALTELQPESITLLNRSVDKALAIRNALATVQKIEAGSFDSVQPGRSFDVIINATSLSLEGQLPPVQNHWLHSQSCCYDMMYADSATVFQNWGREQGAALSLDGLGMLVEQAAESFLIWRGLRPETKTVITALRQG